MAVLAYSVVANVCAAPSTPEFGVSDERSADACGAVCGMDDRNRTSDEIKKAEFRENVKQVLLQLVDDPQIQHKILLLVQKQLRS
jgi:hypothetical protein